MSTKTQVIQAIDDALAVANGLDDNAALVAQLQQQVTTLTTERDAALADAAAKQGKIDAARAQAQADKDADAANVAGQGVLDALA